MPLRFSIRVPRDGGAEAGPAATEEVEVASRESGIVFGRAPDADIQLPFPKVSARHARLWREADGYRVADLGSSNGTRLGGRRLAAQVPEAVAAGETLVLGGVEVGFAGETPLAEAAIAEGAGTETLARRLVHDIFASCPETDGARLVVISGAEPGRELLLPRSGRTCKLGRGEGCDWILSDEDVSREHAAFARGPRGVVIRDLGSKNGVEVAGSSLVGERVLRDGEIVRVGETRLRLIDPEERYLRQMEADGSEPPPGADGPRTANLLPISGARARRPDGDLSPSRLPAIATGTAVAILILAFGLVLAIVLAS